MRLSVLILFIVFQYVCCSKKCGFQYIQPELDQYRIVNGEPIVPHSWPWQVSLHSIPLRSYLCGGTIIAPNWILTVAHCFFPLQFLKDPGSWMIRAAEKSRHRLNDDIQIRKVETIILYQDYVWPYKSNDIALLKLEKPLVFNEKVRPICLPEPGHLLDGNELCFVVGWAHNSDGNDREFNQIILPVLPREICSKEEYHGIRINEMMICAGWEHGGSDACMGDSGRPLMCRFEERWTAVGLVSWGDSCGLPRKPGVYTNVSYYSDWIKKHTS